MEKLERLLLLEHGKKLGYLALRYVLGDSAVSVTMPGAKMPEQVEANVATSARPLLPEEDLRPIREVSTR